MTVTELLTELRRRRVELKPDGDRLQCRTPRGALTPELRQAIAGNKAALLAMLRDAAPVSDPRPPDSLHGWFEQQARITPGRVAVAFGDEQLDYGELNARSNRLAHHLRQLGIGRDGLVGISMERSLDTVVGLLGILKAGAGYVPLDPTYPRERLAFMLRDARLDVLLTQERLLDFIPDTDARVVCTEHEAERIAGLPDDDPEVKLTGQESAYVIYTSGSMGHPKGTVLSHRAICNHMRWMLNAFGFTAADRILQRTSSSFDASVWEFYAPLLCGATLVLAPSAAQRDANVLARTLVRQKITVLQLVPSLLRLLLETDDVEQCTALRHVFCGGEALTADLRDRFHRRFERAELHNLYGPTEATIDTTWWTCPRSDESRVVPIGRPITNAQVYVLDEHINPSPPGVAGELYVAGAGLARGYLHRPELTAERFVPHCFSQAPGERLYRTGDLCRWREDGVLEFLGRVDQQVKVRGYRVEPGEIEASLREQETVRDAAVIVREDDPGDQRLVAYVVPMEGSDPSIDALRGALENRLPDYMVPSSFVTLDALPLLANGKVDRKALPAPAATRPVAGGEFIAPQGDTEQRVAELFATLLKVERVGARDNFFELGGHSLLATQFVAGARAAFDMEISLADFFAAPTVAELAAKVEAARRDDTTRPASRIERIDRTGDLPLSYAQERLWFLDQLEPDNPFYNMPRAVRVRGKLDLQALTRSFREIMARHEVLRTAFDEVDGRPALRVSTRAALEVPLIDLSGVGEAQRDGRVRELAIAEAETPFDLSKGPMLRATVLRLREEEHVFLLTMHHIVSDGWSIGVFITELAQLYQAFATGQPSPLPEMAIQYVDFAAWQREFLSDEALEDQLAYWRERLDGATAELRLPLDRPRPERPTFRGASVRIELSSEVSRKIHELGRERGVTAFMTLLAAFQLLLSRYSGQDQVCVASPIAGRDRPETAGLIGFFVNTLVLRGDLSGDPTFEQLLQRTRETTLGAYANQDLPFERLVEELQPDRDLSRLPMVQAAFAYQNIPIPTIEHGDLSLSPLENDVENALLDLTLFMWERPDRLVGTLQYNADLFDEVTIERMRDRLEALLAEIVEDPGRRVMELPCVDAAERRRLLAKRLRLEGEGRPLELEDFAELSNLTRNQLVIWTGQTMHPDSPVYNVVFNFVIDGEIDPDLFRQAHAALIRSNDALRLVVDEVDGVPQQRVCDDVPLAPEIVDLSVCANPEAELRKMVSERGCRIFDLSKCQYESVLFKLSAKKWVWYFCVHHLINDGWGIFVAEQRLAELYDRAARGELSRRMELPAFAGYLTHERERRTSEHYRHAEAFWAAELSHEVPPLTFFGSAPDMTTTESDRLSVDLGAERTRRIEELAERLAPEGKKHAAVPNMLAAALHAYLHRLSGNRSIALGTPFHNRRSEAFRQTIGCFMETLPVRVEIDGSDSFVDLVGKVWARTREVLRHSQYAQGNPVHRRSYDAFFSFHNWAFASIGESPVTTEWVDNGHSIYALAVAVCDYEGLGKLTLHLDFHRDVFEPSQHDRFARQFIGVIDRMLEDPDRRIDGVAFVDPEETRQVLVDWNDTSVDYRKGVCLHELFEEQAARTPRAEALVFGDQRVSYAELDARANQLARHLRRLGVGRDVAVAACMERSVELVVALYAILKAGGAYVPLDPEYPRDRLHYMLEDCGASILLTGPGTADFAPDDVEHVVDLCAASDRIAAESAERPADDERAAEDGLAYVIYTSGSTGRPKGVMVSHAGICNRLMWMQEVFGLTASDRVMQKTPFSFDVSVWELFWPVLYGATLVVARPGGHRDPDYLQELIASESITTVHFVPSMLKAFLENEDPEGRAAKLGRVICSGEALPADLVARFQELLPAVELHNLYGPTEASVDVTWWPCKREWTGSSVPIGRPIANMRTYVLDPGLEPCPVEVPGELYLGGVGLARGYLARPELTAERFVPDPHAGSPGSRLYRTGDLCRWLPDGTVEFLGRLDHQVKVRGFRIELEEIEAVLREHAAVRDSVVVSRPDAGGETRLVAYLVGTDGAPPTVEELSSWLGNRLPDYMVPQAYVELSSLPLSPNGKVDRKALPEPEGVTLELGTEFVAPRTATERRLVEIWSEQLGVERVGVHDSFFDLGGHSLLATRLVSRVRSAFEVELPLRDLFRVPTIAGLAELIDGAERKPRLPPLEPIGPGEPLPLSFAQERLWFLDRLVPNSAFYNIHAAVRIQGTLDLEALTHSFREIVGRHQVLRSRVTTVEGRPFQEIAPLREFDVPVFDLAQVDVTDLEGEIQRRADEEAARPFDLAAGPPFRVTLLRCSENDHVLLVTMHHIVSDGWSMGVLVREFGTLYSAFVQGEASPLPELPVQYADFARWQRDWLQADVLEAQVTYWRDRLTGMPLLELPTDKPRPAVRTFRGASHRFEIPAELNGSLRELADGEGATAFMTLLAVFQILLARYGGQDDVGVGSPIAGRNRVEIEGLIGFFVNTLVLRTDLSGDPTFRELLVRVREVCLGAYAHQDLPFERLVDALKIERDLSRESLFQAMFVLQDLPLDAEHELPGGLAIRPVERESATSKFDLTLGLAERDGGLEGVFEYNTDLFDAATIERMATAYTRVLAAVVAGPDRPLSALPLLVPAERRLQLETWNGTATGSRFDVPVHERFAQQVERTPDAPAVAAGAHGLTYGELDLRANRLAHRLLELGVAPETPVALVLPRSVDLVVAVLGVLKSGGAYVPLDPDYPAERLAYMLADSGAPVLVTTDSLAAALPGHEARVVRIDTDALENAGDGSPGVTVSGEQLAYVIYTSGSTGRPKGVEIPHAGLANLVGWHQAAFAVTAADRATLVAGPAFDASVWEIWPYLASGASVHLPDDRARSMPADLIDWLAAERITISFLPTPLAEATLDHPWPETMDLRLLLTGGDRLHRAPRAGLPFRLVNNYGPTENSVVATSGPVVPGDDRVPTIGRPIANVRLYLLDQRRQPVPIGAPGELYIGGASLARGYHDRPELTAHHFVPDPFDDTGDSRLYRTGDLCRYRADGEIEFLGRIDDQVKVRGFRIELGEIEAVLAEHPDVREATVLARDDTPGERRLVAYVVAAENVSIRPDAIRDFLCERLPDYMVPTATVCLDALPVTPNGKVDRRALAAPDAGAPGTEFVAPSSEVETTLARIWSEVLAVERVGVRDNFFELGGHSLSAVRVIAGIEKELGRELPLTTLFHGPTVEQLAAALEQDPARADDSHLLEIQPSGSKPPLFCVHQDMGLALGYLPLARHLGHDQPVYGLQASGTLGQSEPCENVVEMAAHYVGAMRSVQPRGPYFIAGHSFGAQVGLEMAQQLVAAGQRVGMLAVIDALAPHLMFPEGTTAPVMEDAALLAQNAGTLERLLSLRLDVSEEHLRTLAPEDQVPYVLERIRDARAAMERNGGADDQIELALTALIGGGAALMRGTLNVSKACKRASMAYTAQPYPGRVTLFRAASVDHGLRPDLRPDPSMGWDAVAAGKTEIHEIPGDHLTMITEPHVRVLAQRLLEGLRR